MTAEQIQLLLHHGRFPDASPAARLLETHISWVILGPKYVYKIKKPVRFSFLDFSNLEKRKFYCQEEVRLNRRLAPAMYIDVLPVCLNADGLPEIQLHENTADALDYAVHMNRMDTDRQMDKLLLKNAVTTLHLEELARVLVRFHRSAVLHPADINYTPGENRVDFDDLFRYKSEAVQALGPAAAARFKEWEEQIGRFLEVHESRFQERIQAGFWVDGHGDLHARNIFLLPTGPLVFDCIEFNPHLRQLDVLNDLAFLCMELEASGGHEFSSAFMAAYTAEWNCIQNQEDSLLFDYFKAYRANVRLKVHLMAFSQQPTPETANHASRYFALLKQYFEKFI